MAGRRHIPPSLDRRPVQSPGMMQHGSLPGLGRAPSYRLLEQLPCSELLENKIAYQAAEIKQLTGDNQRLAASQVDLRQELLAAEEEVQTVKAHMRSIQTETDIQIRALIDKIAKKQIELGAGEGVKKKLQKAHVEAHSLVEARKELRLQMCEAITELQKAHTEVKKLPDLHGKLDNLKEEHQRLHATFAYEKGVNIDEVEQMREMEKSLMSMAGEVEMLCAEVLNAEKRAKGYLSSLPLQMVLVRILMVMGGPYVAMINRPLGEGLIIYASSSSYTAAGVPTPGNGAICGRAYNPLLDTTGIATVPTTGSSVVWGAYDSASARQ